MYLYAACSRRLGLTYLFVVLLFHVLFRDSRTSKFVVFRAAIYMEVDPRFLHSKNSWSWLTCQYIEAQNLVFMFTIGCHGIVPWQWVVIGMVIHSMNLLHSHTVSNSVGRMAMAVLYTLSTRLLRYPRWTSLFVNVLIRPGGRCLSKYLPPTTKLVYFLFLLRSR